MSQWEWRPETGRLVCRLCGESTDPGSPNKDEHQPGYCIARLQLRIERLEGKVEALEAYRRHDGECNYR